MLESMLHSLIDCAVLNVSSAEISRKNSPRIQNNRTAVSKLLKIQGKDLNQQLHFDGLFYNGASEVEKFCTTVHTVDS